MLPLARKAPARRFDSLSPFRVPRPRPFTGPDNQALWLRWSSYLLSQL
jgi:hypothetical protein